jgi:apolipoprotein N-acyltransferase
MSARLSRIALVIASGLALALAFPKFDFNLLAWVAFVPFFYATDGEPLGRLFGWAWLQGLVAFTGSLYWIPIPLHNFADVRLALAIIPMFLLAGIMAIYSAVALWGGEFISRRLRISPVVTLPIAWAALELVRTHFPIGFPWNLLGYAAYKNTELIQFAEVTGVYGISALIMFFNAVVFQVAFRRASYREQTASLTALTAIMLLLFGFGAWRISNVRNMPTDGSFKVAMVQGDIPQSLKWEPNFLPESFKVYEDETAKAVERGADLVVWPEAAAAFLFQPDDRYPIEYTTDKQYRDTLLQLARNTGKPILFGAPALATDSLSGGFYNRAYLVSGKGEIEGSYDKMILVPFGEYVPGREVFGYFVNRVVQGFGDMIPGTHQTIFDVDGAKLGVLICYESIFPDLTRLEVKAGADVLVNITNDAWYGESSAPYQALAMAAMRSAETKVPMIRAANTGVSAIISATGAITFPTPLFKRGTEIENVGWRPVRTIYTVVGDLFSQICLALTIVGLALGWLRPRAEPLAAEPPAMARAAVSGNGRR